MALVADIVSWLFILTGSFFVVAGGIGLVRLPDVFTRVHAVSLIDGAGAGLILIGLAVQAGFSLVAFKLIAIWVLILFTVPVATHAVAQAALIAGIKPMLAQDRRSKAPAPQREEA